MTNNPIKPFTEFFHTLAAVPEWRLFIAFVILGKSMMDALIKLQKELEVKE